MNFLRKIALLVLLVLPAAIAFSQEPIPTPELPEVDPYDLNSIIEDALTDIESDDQTDWSLYTDNLQDFLANPLDLNSASSEELLLLPGMSDLLITNLLDYIDRFGKLTSIYELQAVPGYDYSIFTKIKPFISCKASGELDMGSKDLHPAGPSFRDILKNSNHEIWLRALTILEKQKGYTPPDTNSNGTLTTRYEGKSPVRSYFRYRMKYARNFSAALVMENDPGEPFRWDPSKNFYGFDYLAGHIFIRDFKNLKRAVVGDYTIRAGQGLILSPGIGFNKGGDVIGPVKKQGLGVLPYYSLNENQFFRGAATTVAVKRFYMTGFFSYNLLDANASQDTASQQLDFVTSLQTSGFHRTPSEISNKDALPELVYGGRVEYKARRLSIGITQFMQHFGRTLTPSNKPYQLYNLSGNLNFLTGIDFDWTIRNFNIFGEIARSKSGGIGAIVGVLTSLHPKLDLSILGRSFDQNFHSTRGYAFAERPLALQNERGIYIGILTRPLRKWTLSAYADHFWFPWQNFGVNFPSFGREYLAQVEFKPSRKMTIYARFRSDHKEKNAGVLPDDQLLETLTFTRRQSIRVHYSQKIGRELTLSTRFEHSWYRKGEEVNSKGMLFYQDISWAFARGWKATGRFALFDSEDFNARIYAYENDIYGTFSILPYSGTGARYYFMLKYGYRFLDVWVRYGAWNYLKQNTVSSGLNEIQGNVKSDLRLQVRFSF